KTFDDPALWYGDVVELLIETNSNHYYQIAVNPAGAMVDLKRIEKKQIFKWDSRAEVATLQGDGFWNIEMRIPYVDDNDDPLHMLNGRKPSPTLPWYFNICRQRVTDTETQFWAFSPTGKKNFHVLSKFAKLYEGLSKEEKARPRKDHKK
ncbi:MAG: DOMON domain-containing protein, partial [Planctomycetota bacterium]